MRFGFTEKQEALRKELNDFIATEMDSDWKGAVNEEYGTDEGWEAAQRMSRKLAAKGLLTMSWPREYGGRGATRMEHLIYRETMSYNMVPGCDMGVGGVMWIGPSLIIFGTDEQKKRHLPGISSGQTFWCTGYSEPEAGSDMASLRCRAVKKNGDYVVNGQKIWCSAAHRADWCWLATRTDPDVPKHKGISLFLLDMKTPGITVNPLENIAGEYSNSEVFFDDVRIPGDCLVGEENDGWRCMMRALDFERTAAIEYIARNRRMLSDIMDFAKDAKLNGKPMIEDPITRQKLSELAIKTEVGRLMAYNIAWMEDQGLVPSYQASMSKTFCAELLQESSNIGVGLMGLYGQLECGSRAPVGGAIEQAYLYTRGDTIAGGTSEINRMVIAMRGLGLPRG